MAEVLPVMPGDPLAEAQVRLFPAVVIVYVHLLAGPRFAFTL